MIVLLCFWFIAAFISSFFVDPANEATFAPMLVFCPWIKIIGEAWKIYNSKFLVALITTLYIWGLYLVGKRLIIYIPALCLHYACVYLAISSITVGELDEDLMVWGVIIALPTSIFYYFFDLIIFSDSSLKKKSEHS